MKLKPDAAPREAGGTGRGPRRGRARTSSKSSGRSGTTSLQFQSGLLHRDAELRVSGQHELHLRYRPLDRVGVYCPGGAAAYPSTLLMTVCPAQAAGVEEIVVVHAADSDTGAYNRDMLAICHELGVTEVYRSAGPRRSRRWPTASTGSRRWT